MTPNEMTMPSVSPSGLRRPPNDDDDRTIGSRGQIQGAAIVTNPERNAKNSRISTPKC